MMLKILGLCKVFNTNTINENKVFDNFNVDIKKGEFVTIIGSNGAGKSTLDRKSTRLNSSHIQKSRMPSSA